MVFANSQLTEMPHSFLHPFKIVFPTQSPSETLGSPFESREYHWGKEYGF